ncbi:glutamate racemase [bacterium]|jgi:glutamate racemase|nr:glutamate racemase [bacterium]MBT4335410.1 glutamate racemase [bacterium]MBT4495677.1 glutamate racemase [bacterium]MBT4763802.1 glutamate racemase [bacterium]MBT5401172.1 glutamate racemase [bacterium]
MIGIFDSGYGGLTVFKEIKKLLPDYSYIYLGDNLRTPYGGRSQEAVYEFTKEAASFLFNKGCHLIIIACNTASSEALRKLQQEWLPSEYPDRKILGVIRPLAEVAVLESKYKKIGVVGTKATIESESYNKELKAQDNDLNIYTNACPLLVPLVEEGWLKNVATRMVIKKCLRPLKDRNIDTLILGCTHYPLLMKEFKAIAGKRVKVLDAPLIVAEKLADYLKKHSEIETQLEKNKTIHYYTTDSSDKFNKLGSKFLGEEISSEKVELK